MSMHFAPQWLKQPIKPSGAPPAPAGKSTPVPVTAAAPAQAQANAFPPLVNRPASPFSTISYSHIAHPSSSPPTQQSQPGAGQDTSSSSNGTQHPFRYSRSEILSLFDPSKSSTPPIELSHLVNSVIYSEAPVQPIGLRDVNEIEKRLLASSVNPRLLRPGPGAAGGTSSKGFGKGEGGAFAKELQTQLPVGSPVQGQGQRRVPGPVGEKIETPVRSSANNWRPSRTLSSSGSLASPGAGFEGVLGFGSISPAPPTPTSSNGLNGIGGDADAGPGWGSGNRRWRSAAATAQERSSHSTMATPSATPVPERDATVATPAPAQPDFRQETLAPEPSRAAAEIDPATVIWYYRDPSGNQQGPFAATQMHEWYLLNYFQEDLPLRRDSETEYHTLRDLKTATGNPTQPFLAKLLPKAPPPMLPPNLPIPGYNIPSQQPQPWGGFPPQPQQGLVQPFENLAIQHPFAPYQQHIPQQPIYSPVIGGPAQRANGFYSPAVGVPLADVNSPWGVPQPQQQPWQTAPVPQQPSYFPPAPVAPSPYVEQPVPRDASAPAPEPIREIAPVNAPEPESVSEVVPSPEVTEAAPVEASPSPAPATPATPATPAATAPAPSAWGAKAVPAQAADSTSTVSSPAISTPVPVAAPVTSLPPAHASLPAKPATRQSVPAAPVSAAATAENSPVTTPAKPASAKAPWAAAKEEDKGRASPVGPSLREIQEAEAKEASARKAAERAAAGSPAPMPVANGSPSPDLPQQMSWGLPGQGSKSAVSSPSLAQSTGPVWGGGDAAAPKKTLKQIQEEEEKRKARVAAQVKAQATANGAASAAAKRGYADLAAAPVAAAAAGGAWSTVGAGGKASAGAVKPAAVPVKPVAAAAKPAAPPVVSRKVVVDEQPSVEFIRWTKQALIGLSGVNVDEFIQMLLLFPIEPGAQRAETLEIIADSVYANSSTLDGRRFAQEFYTKRKLDAQARTSAKISSLADVVKTQPKPAPTSDFGFKVVKAKGKGRK